MARFGDGLAAGGDLLAAAERATASALGPLGGRVPDLLCVFATGPPEEVAQACLRAVEVSAATSSIGCSAGGVIGGARGVEGEPAVSVFAAVLPDVRVRSFHLEVMRAEAGAAVVGMPEHEDDEVAVLLADPYSFPADGFVTQANLALPGLPVVGGLAAGALGAGSTRLLVDGRVVDRGAVGVLLKGAGVRTLVSQGCRPVGPAMTVTAASGNVVRELAGVPALQRVEQVLAELPPADQALASTGLQLGIAMDEYAEDHDFLVRAILGADRETGGLVVGDLVETGTTVRLQVRDADAADADLRALLAGYRRDTRDAPAGGALLFSCNGRGAHLFGTADHDPALVRSELAALGVAGFFAGGELGPVGGRNHLHGFTASVLAFPC
jgi:small ligand-binding sensory domain FIST